MKKFKIGDGFLKNNVFVGEIIQYENKMFLLETEYDLKGGDKLTSFFNDDGIDYKIRLVYPSELYGIAFKHPLNEIFNYEHYDKFKIIIFE